MHKPIIAVAAAALLAACATTTTPAPQPRGAAQVDHAEAAFWRGFGDPTLAALVDDALAANQDLAAAAARFAQARALLMDTRRDRLPSVTASAEAADVRASATQLPGAPRDARDGRAYEAALVSGWELDLFGRVRNRVAAARAERDASGAELAAAQVAVVAELASTYFELRGLQEQLDVARRSAENQQETLSIVRTRVDAGRGTEFDLARADAQLAGTLALVPALEAEIAVRMHRLAVLTGRQPDALTLTLASQGPMSDLGALPQLPGDLLRRRPDVRAAERRLAAAAARTGVAQADLWPRFTLAGLIGSHAGTTDGLFERDSEVRLAVLGVDWSFLDHGRMRARVEAAKAGADAARAAYQSTVLRALEESENAIARHRGAVAESARLAEAAAAGAEAARLARLRYDAGAADLLHVLDAERAQLDFEARLAGGRARTAVALVATYRAIAGGWPAT